MSETGKEYGEMLKEIRIRKELNRIKYAIFKLKELGYISKYIEKEKCITFMYRDAIVKFYPYTGWHTGKTIKDGRGICNLIKQLV